MPKNFDMQNMKIFTNLGLNLKKNNNNLGCGKFFSEIMR